MFVDTKIMFMYLFNSKELQKLRAEEGGREGWGRAGGRRWKGVEGAVVQSSGSENQSDGMVVGTREKNNFPPTSNATTAKQVALSCEFPAMLQAPIFRSKFAVLTMSWL